MSSTNETEVDAYGILPGADDLNIFGGALVSGADINLAMDSEVNGDILYEGEFDAKPPFTHNDGELINTEVQLPTQEENEEFVDGVRQDAQSHWNYTGSYYVPQGNGVDVTDLGPIYISGDLDIARDNIINFIGPVFVEGNIDMDKDAEFTGGGHIIAVGNVYLAKTNDFGTNRDSLLMSLNGSIVFKKEVDLRALIYAPNGDIRFDKEASVTGSVIAGGNIQADKSGSYTQSYDYFNQIDLPGYSSEAIKPIIWELE
jgi:hypothetical protein